MQFPHIFLLFYILKKNFFLFNHKFFIIASYFNFYDLYKINKRQKGLNISCLHKVSQNENKITMEEVDNVKDINLEKKLKRQYTYTLFMIEKKIKQAKKKWI